MHAVKMQELHVHTTIVFCQTFCIVPYDHLKLFIKHVQNGWSILFSFSAFGSEYSLDITYIKILESNTSDSIAVVRDKLVKILNI